MQNSIENDVEDPVDLMLKTTGCINLHHKVQVKLYHLYLYKKKKRHMYFLYFLGVHS